MTYNKQLKFQAQAALKSLSSNGCSVYGRNGKLIVNGNNGMTVKVMSIDGKTVYAGHDSKISLIPGIYIVKLGTNTFKVRI